MKEKLLYSCMYIDILIYMITGKLKKVLILLLIAGFILGGIKIDGNIENIGDTENEIKSLITTTQERDEPELKVSFNTNLESHREDKMPSIKSQNQFSFYFNITNINETAAYDVKLNFSLNDLGVLVSDGGEESNSAFETVGTLNGHETYLSKEYKVNVTTNETISESLDLVIVLDQSGSMDDEIEALTSDLISVVNELSDTINDLRIGLVLFGGEKENPYLFEELVTPLTSDVQQIVKKLKKTKASGSIEPWGDALWVAMYQMDWREDVPNLIVLITDEAGDDGIKVSTRDLQNLYEQLAEEKFILCTVAAKGSDELTIERLSLGAEITHGTYVRIGTEEFPSTADLPRIIKYFIETYSVEKALKIFLTVTYLTIESDTSSTQTIEKVFRVLVDDLPPEIRAWASYTEDFNTEQKYVNIIVEVLDVSRVPFVEVFYRYNDNLTWVIAQATNQSGDTFILSLKYDDEDELLSYYIYTEDYLGNDIVTGIYTAPLGENVEYLNLLPNERFTFHLYENQSTIFYLEAKENSTIGLIDAESPVNIICLDVKKGEIVYEKTGQDFINLSLSSLSLYKIKIWTNIAIDVNIYNVEKINLEFEQNMTITLTYNQSILLYIDNRLNLSEQRTILADSEYVEMKIIIYDVNWTEIASGFVEVLLPEDECFVLIYPSYHEGEIFVSFNLDSKNEPFEHYYGVTADFQFLVILISFISLSALILKQNGAKK